MAEGRGRDGSIGSDGTARPPAGSTALPDQAVASDVPPVAEPSSVPAQPSRSRGGAILIASGILLSRIIGLVRERAFAHYFGNSPVADAFKAALRIPNVLQNLLGEGVLSASFIPVYARLVGTEDREGARRVAAGVFLVLTAVTVVVVLCGTLAAPFLIDIITPGFVGERRDLAIALIRIFFPAIGVLVLSAWCLGVLNSHGRFFLPYAAPVLWNLVFIAALFVFGGSRPLDELAIIVAWSTVVGGILQLAVQLPPVLGLLGGLPRGIREGAAGVRQVVRNFIPVVVGRGVVQISAFIDSMVASLLPTGAVAALSYVQIVYLLPISLFGMSVSAAELPSLSQVGGEDSERNAMLRRRLERGLRQIGFFVVPTMTAFIVFGDALVGAVFETGRFTREDTRYVWFGVAAASVGLLAVTLARLYSSGFYAVGDTRTPLRYSIIRVIVSSVGGVVAAIYLPRLIGIDTRYGLQLLVGASAVASILEYFLLRRGLSRKLQGKIALPRTFAVRVWAAAFAAAAGAVAFRAYVPLDPIALDGIAASAVFGVIYLGSCLALRIEEASRFAWRTRGRAR